MGSLKYAIALFGGAAMLMLAVGSGSGAGVNSAPTQPASPSATSAPAAPAVHEGAGTVILAGCIVGGNC